ncbi:hypothetical protein [Pseudobacter ginsenosidimutans]|uniref:Uncharacterized protein n=1 Tax=Pseudobacter ginsenosidimutans TaxID=661488 RepID=A0A4Q7N3R4_9BACT|nr:hypothetical protein [Pseudobacter ginsenosidimutans]RZS75615.1 hypothetical protein EV199_1485 [Pseudobacter ginsenosidimutans]
MSVDYKAIAIGIVFIPIVWILQILPLHDYLNYLIPRFSNIAYATGPDGYSTA